MSLNSYQSISVIRCGSDESPSFVAILANPSPDPAFIWLCQQAQGATVEEAISAAQTCEPYPSGPIHYSLDEERDLMSIIMDGEHGELTKPALFKPRRLL